MKNSYEVRAKKFIEMIDEYVNDCERYLDFDSAIRAFNYKKSRHVIFEHGSTRIALITSDYVIKFDFGQRYQIQQFGGCEKEIEMYEMAYEDNMDYLFAKITPYTFNGTTYYIMPRVKNVGKTEADAWEYMTEEERDWCIEHNLFDLHNGNYGWKNNHIVIIDYGAF